MKLKIYLGVCPNRIDVLLDKKKADKDRYLRIEEKTIDIPDALLTKSAKPKKSGKVTTICYGKRDTWNSAKDAIDYFNNAANNSDGCERERYLTIVSKLVDGETKDVTDSFG